MDEYLMQDEKFVELEREQMLEAKDGAYAYSNAEMRKLAELPIPAIVLSQYNAARAENLQCCLSGIWPTINRVFITINNQLFLWNYINGAEVTRFEPVARPIEAIALGPRTAMLPPTAAHSVWVATDTAIKLFGLQLSPALDLLPTDFSVLTEGDRPNRIAVAPNGRVFYGGSEGHLNEVNYTEDGSWFARRPKMVRQDRSASWLESIVPNFFIFGQKFIVEDIVVDETRNTLYTLMQRHNDTGTVVQVESRICVYDLGKDGTGFAEVCKIGQSELEQAIRAFDERALAESFPRAQVASILSVERSYSDAIQLLLVLGNGTRVYLAFETRHRTTMAPSEEMILDSRYRVAAVRFPPSVVHPAPGEARWDQEISGMPSPPKGIRQVDRVLRSWDGRFLLLSDLSASNAASSLLMLGSNEAELANIKHSAAKCGEGQLRELLSCIEDQTNGTVTDLAEEPLRVEPPAVEGLVSGPPYVGDRRSAYSTLCMPGTAKSVYAPARECYVLTTQTLSTFVRLRPVDQLYTAVDTPDPRILDAFVSKYGRVETCALLLSIVCNAGQNYWADVPTGPHSEEPGISSPSKASV